MIRILFYVVALITIVSLIGCQKNVTQEAIENELISTIYKDFINNPQGAKKQIIETHGQGVHGLLQDILLEKNKPSETTLKAFSQLLAEIYRNAIDTDLSSSENANYAQTLGTIMGSLTGLREEVIVQRHERFLPGWYDYTEFDKRWLALLTDIVSLAPSYKLPEHVIKVAHTGNVTEFSESLIQSEHTKQTKGEDLVTELIHQTVEALIARFNGFVQETERSMGSIFNITRVSAWDDIRACRRR